MLKKTLRSTFLCAAGTLALLLFLNGPHFGLIRGEAPEPQQGARTGPATSGQTRETIYLERAPLRVVEDRYSSFNALALDVGRDEIILSDPNKAQIMVYGRLDNTPPQATLTEPKRIIGGSITRIAHNCGIYVDPTTGDIYNVNGDTEDWMSVFSRDARGNVRPDRSLAVPHRAFGVMVDEEAQELFVTIQHPPAVVVWPKLAEGNDAPLRILEGDKTLLAEPQGMALDTANQLLYVANQGATSSNSFGQGWRRALRPGASTWEIPRRILDYVPGSGRYYPPSITVHPLKADGDTPPLRVIQGTRTRLNWPSHIFLDAERQELYVANPATHEILVFRATDNGNVAPIRVLSGPRTGIKNPFGVFVDTKNDEIVVANFGDHAAMVYPRTASGDTPPIRTIRAAPRGTPAPGFGNVGSLAYDTRRDQILAPN